jgi:hypothetical protein
MPTSETLTNKLRRAGLDFSNRVAVLAADSPDISTRRMLNKVAHSVRKRYGYSDAEKESEILKCIRDGAATVKELIEETGFADYEVARATKNLLESNKIRIERMRIGRRGPPSYLILTISD